MAKSTVITFRCEDDVLEQIDALVRKHHYFKRSSFIMAGLQIMIELDKKGLAREALSYYENGKREPSLALLVEMSKYYNVSINYLITGEEFQKR